jgi:L-alanine-DL-glutamate epimerase-like enolase superfamily enzyme
MTRPPWPARDDVRITGARVIVTAPEGVNLVVVRIDTSEDGLYGLGCATFNQRSAAVVAAVEQHLRPFLIGRSPADITDLTRMLHFSGYWRSGPVLNSALSGVDMALWDIAGKRATMPVYELLGGRVRGAVPVYVHAYRGRLCDALDGAGLGHRDRRAARRETPSGVRRIRTLGDHRAPPGRCGRTAVRTGPEQEINACSPAKLLRGARRRRRGVGRRRRGLGGRSGGTSRRTGCSVR